MGFSRFTKLEHLTLSTCLPLQFQKIKASAIENVLAALPLLRSLTLRGCEMDEFSSFALVSDSLQSFVMDSGKYLSHVSSYRCPKLSTLCFEHLWFENQDARVSAWEALKAGVHALDMRSLPASTIGQGAQDWFNSNIGSFVEGAYETKANGAAFTNEWDTHM